MKKLYQCWKCGWVGKSISAYFAQRAHDRDKKELGKECDGTPVPFEQPKKGE